MTKEPEVVLCPYCQQPFKSNGINRHITVKHGKEKAGKDKAKMDEFYANEAAEANLSSEVPSSQSEPSLPIPPIPDPIIGYEALRANVDPMVDAGEIYTELDAPDPVSTPLGIVIKAVEECLGHIVGEKVPPIPQSPQKVINQIPIGSEIELNGPVYWQNPANLEWEIANADHIRVLVIGHDIQDSEIHLIMRVNCGQALWSVLQSEVLAGKYRVIKLAKDVPIIPESLANVSDIPLANEVRDKARSEFLPILNEYLEYKERLELAEHAFMDLHERVYQQLENYVLQWGEQINEEADTPYLMLEEDGIRMRLVEGSGLMFEKIREEENV